MFERGNLQCLSTHSFGWKYFGRESLPSPDGCGGQNNNDRNWVGPRDVRENILNGLLTV